MKISLDLDNVIFDAEFVYRAAHNQYNLEYVPPVDWKMSNYDQRIIESIYDMFNNPYVMGEIIPFKHSVDYLKRLFNILKDRHEVYAISSRNKCTLSKTKYRLLSIFPDVFKDVIFTPSRDNKIETFQSLGIEYVIDDSPDVIEACINNNIDCVLISEDTYFYNHHLRDKCNYEKNLVDALSKRLNIF